MIRVLRVVLAPRWLVRHVLVGVALATCFGFGRWQLGRAEDRHSLLNWSYAIEWALFGAFALLVWGWYLRDELIGTTRDPGALQEAAPDRPVYLPRAQPVSEDEDPELAAYNAYLASLNASLNASQNDNASLNAHSDQKDSA